MKSNFNRISIVLILCIFINVFPSTKMTVEEFKNQIASIKSNPYKTFECEIEIEDGGKVIGTTKLYQKDKQSRIEIKGNKTVGIEDMVIVQDTNGTYTKSGKEKWVKGTAMQGMSYKQTDAKTMAEGFIEKNGFEVLDYSNNVATIKYNEEMMGGVTGVKVGINMKNGDMIFQEMDMNEGSSKVIFQYGEMNGKRYMKEMKISTQTKYGNKEMVIRYKNVKIDKGINNKLFKVED